MYRKSENTILSEDSKKFKNYLLELKCGALLTPAIGIGGNLGLFDAIIDMNRPATCEEIAKAGKFKER